MTQNREGVSPSEGKKRLEKFVNAFLGAEEACRELTQAMVGEEDSVVAYLDEHISAMKDLKEEIRGLRKDLRQMAKSNGFAGIFEILRGGG